MAEIKLTKAQRRALEQAASVEGKAQLRIKDGDYWWTFIRSRRDVIDRLRSLGLIECRDKRFLLGGKHGNFSLTVYLTDAGRAILAEDA